MGRLPLELKVPALCSKGVSVTSCCSWDLRIFVWFWDIPNCTRLTPSSVLRNHSRLGLGGNTRCQGLKLGQLYAKQELYFFFCRAESTPSCAHCLLWGLHSQITLGFTPGITPRGAGNHMLDWSLNLGQLCPSQESIMLYYLSSPRGFNYASCMGSKSEVWVMRYQNNTHFPTQSHTLNGNVYSLQFGVGGRRNSQVGWACSLHAEGQNSNPSYCIVPSTLSTELGEVLIFNPPPAIVSLGKVPPKISFQFGR